MTILALTVFFRDALLARLTMLYGDSYDGGIEVAILDHWYQVVAHGAAWNVVGWFAPYGNTLGYNDSYVIPGIFFVVGRLFGLDPFAATFLSHVAMKAIGLFGMYALLRRGLRIDTGLALAGAAIFATSNASLLQMYHAQLLAVGLVPWLMLFAVVTVRAAVEDRGAALLRNGIAFVLLFGLAALNAVYPIWFFALFALVFVPVGTIVAGQRERRLLWAAARRHRRMLALLAAVGGGALIPLLLVYLPKLSESGGHSFVRDIRGQLPIAQTLVNVGPGNWVWGHILPLASFHPGEQRVGFPPGLLLVALLATGWAWRRRGEARLMLATGITVGLLLLLAMRWGADTSAWWLVYRFVPGAQGIRVVTRLLLVLLIPIIALAMMLLQHWRRHRVAVVLTIAFLLAEQVQLAAPLSLDRRAQMAMLIGVGAPPRACDTFFVVSARRRDEPLQAEADRIVAGWGVPDRNGLLRRYRHNVDAMLLASYYGRSTINGFSTFNPPDWRFERPDDPGYLDRIRAYARRHPVGRLCGLDRRRSQPWFALRY